MKTSRNPLERTSTRKGGPRRRKIPGEWAWHYRTLLALRDHLMGRTGDRLRESCEAMEPPSLHAEDLADELYDRDLALALPADSREAYREVNDALARLKTGAYGRCEATGRPIPKARLRAMPWCRYASKAAQRSGGRGSPSPLHASQQKATAPGDF